MNQYSKEELIKGKTVLLYNNRYLPERHINQILDEYAENQSCLFAEWIDDNAILHAEGWKLNDDDRGPAFSGMDIRTAYITSELYQLYKTQSVKP